MTTDLEDSATRGAGRPRDPRIEQAALGAVRDLLVESGYAGVSVAAVAERAGTTKAALYRRWPSLPHLVYEAAFPDEIVLGMSLGGALRTDLAGIVRGTRDALCTPVVAAALSGLLPEFTAHPELHSSLLARFAGVWGAIDDRLRVGAEQGEARSGARADDVLRVVVGAVVLGLLLEPEGLDDDWADRLTTILERGLRP